LIAAFFAAGCDGGRAPAGAAPDSVAAPAAGAEAIDTALSAAEQYLGQGDLASAGAIADRLLERAPQDWRCAELKARVLLATALSSGDRPAAYHAAADAYRTAVALHPSSAGLRQAAGSAAAMARRPDEALEHYLAAMALDPANPQYPLFAAQVLIERRDFDAASTLLQRVLALDADEPLALASAATIAFERGDAAGALALMDEARRISPEHLGLRLAHARLLRRSGSPKLGLELLAGLAPEDRRNPGVAAEIAACTQSLGPSVP
jgi:Tfp pilus assembly protein PilF